jgi:hypothetical protein
VVRQNMQRVCHTCISIGGHHFETALVNTIKNDTHDVQLINIYENETRNLEKRKTLTSEVSPYTEVDFDMNETFSKMCSCLKLPAIDIPATPESL